MANELGCDSFERLANKEYVDFTVNLSFYHISKMGYPHLFMGLGGIKNGLLF